MKAEAFEEPLSRVSRRVATLARQSAAELRAERIAASRAARQGRGPATRRAVLHITDTGQRLIARCTAPGSATAAAFRRLASRSAEPAHP